MKIFGTIILLFIAIGFAVQAYFINHAIEERKSLRNLVYIEGGCARYLARWDRSNVEEGIQKGKSVRKDIQAITQLIIDNNCTEPVHFSDNVYMRFNTVDLKSETGDIKLNETSQISNKGDKPDIQ